MEDLIVVMRANNGICASRPNPGRETFRGFAVLAVHGFRAARPAASEPPSAKLNYDV